MPRCSSCSTREHRSRPARSERVAGAGLPRPQSSPKLLFCTFTALALLEAFCQQAGVSMASAEPHGWDVFHQLLRSGEVPARLCTDAYLAAVAMANGWRLVSFDRDFERFEGLARLALPGAQ